MSPAGQELLLRFHHPGELVGELGFRAGERREQAVAVEPSEVLEVPYPDLLTQLCQSSDNMAAFVAIVCGRLADAYDRLRSIAFGHAVDRLGGALLDLAEDPGRGGADERPVALHVTQDQLGRIIGNRREVVSRLMNRLRRQGLVSYRRKGPITVDRRALRAFLDSLPARRAVGTPP